MDSSPEYEESSNILSEQSRLLQAMASHENRVKGVMDSAIVCSSSLDLENIKKEKCAAIQELWDEGAGPISHPQAYCMVIVINLLARIRHFKSFSWSSSNRIDTVRTMKYSPPSSAKPFTLRLPNEDILDWRQLLQLSKLGPATYENTQDKVNYGVSRTWLSNARDYWLDQYDWRAQEEHINSFDNYTMQIECIDLHFIAIFSEKEDAIPIVLIHGWPGSFVEFLPMLDLIRGQYSKRDMPYHIIIPSLPGYTLSKGLPTDVHWTMEDSARILNTLMMNLGFQEYLAQGGDVGSFEARRMAQDYDACVGVHVNLYITQPSLEDSQLEDTALVKAEEWLNQSSSYAQEQATRPSTIGHVLSSSPLALLAWIGEKFLEWSDEEPSLDSILTNVSLYWFTSSYPTSICISWFPHEIFPAIKHVIEKECNLVFYKEHDKGGHFAALECPKEFWEDVEEFATRVWSTTTDE